MGFPLSQQQVVVIGGLGCLDDNIGKAVRYHDRFGWRWRRRNSQCAGLLMRQSCFEHWPESLFAVFLESAK